jgi:hypothetical protein
VCSFCRIYEAVRARDRTEIDCQQAAGAEARIGEPLQQRALRIVRETRIANRRAEGRKPFCIRKRTTAVLLHADPEVRKAQRELVRDLGVHRRPEQHQ